MDELYLPEDPAARTQQILARAAKQFDQLSAGAPAVVKDFVRRVVQRVVVHPDRIEVEVGKQKLRDTLTADPHASSARSATHQPEQGSSDVISFNIEARVKRCGGEMRLVFPPDHPGQNPAFRFVTVEGADTWTPMVRMDRGRRSSWSEIDCPKAGTQRAIRRQGSGMRFPRSRHCGSDPRWTPVA